MINILTGIDSTSSALNAERIRMDVVSQNIANINLYEGMVDLRAASRSYEANLSAAKTARSMALQTLAIGKR
jgi:flagellar basal body rod protein FlgC